MSTTEEIIGSLASAQVIPDIIPSKSSFASSAPSVLFSISWPSGAEALLGNTLARDSVLDEPDVRITPLGAATTGRYTLVMTDPDAPSRADPKYRQFRHWVITGLTTPDAKEEALIATKTKPSTGPYYPPSPPPGSGYHRYTFLLFEEPTEGLTIPGDAVEYGAVLQQRRSWNALEFAARYDLKLVGANYFLCHVSE